MKKYEQMEREHLASLNDHDLWMRNKAIVDEYRQNDDASYEGALELLSLSPADRHPTTMATTLLEAEHRRRQPLKSSIENRTNIVIRILRKWLRKG